jgi:hypothetical protein
MEVGEEVHEFLETIGDKDLPTIDLAAVMDQIVASINTPDDPKDDHETLALVAGLMAYGEGLHEGPFEMGDGWSLQQKSAVFDAVMQLGWRMRYRIADLGLIDAERRFFSHRFKEIERDHILRLEQDEYQPDATETKPATASCDRAGYRPVSDAPHFTDVGIYQEVSTRRSTGGF